jgi:hypothetical protein
MHPMMNATAWLISERCPPRMWSISGNIRVRLTKRNPPAANAAIHGFASSTDSPIARPTIAPASAMRLLSALKVSAFHRENPEGKVAKLLREFVDKHRNRAPGENEACSDLTRWRLPRMYQWVAIVLPASTTALTESFFISSFFRNTFFFFFFSSFFFSFFSSFFFSAVSMPRPQFRGLPVHARQRARRCRCVHAG